MTSSERLVPPGHADPGNMYSYAMDVWLDDPGVLRDRDALLSVMRAAAEHGCAVVLGESSHVFPNAAVTAVLVLSQSHLSVHTWPEHRAANFDVLTCGPLNGELMVDHLRQALKPARCTVTRTVRSLV